MRVWEEQSDEIQIAPLLHRRIPPETLSVEADDAISRIFDHYVRADTGAEGDGDGDGDGAGDGEGVGGGDGGDGDGEEKEWWSARRSGEMSQAGGCLTQRLAWCVSRCVSGEGSRSHASSNNQNTSTSDSLTPSP